MSGKRIISIAFLVLVVAGLLIYAATIPAVGKFSSPFSFLNSNQEVSVVVVGDIMLDRNVRNKINESGFDVYVSGVKNLISDADIAVGNLEGPFTNNPSKTASLESKELVFTFDPALAPKLAEAGFDILGLANNHTLNFGQEGLDSTRSILRQAGIFYYGEPNNKDELSVVVEQKGIKVGFVGFHEFSYMNFDRVLAEIDRIRPEVDFLIVSPHWGIEYQKEPTDFMKNWAHQFIDHGADVVIGAHPHVIGATEEYKNKKIFYSLGNFIFDQYFSKETSQGLVVNIVLKKVDDKIESNYTLTRVAINRQGVTVSE
jgi:poly-gamma-glutamate synthesis protein (capsule biosynthesis protein)